MVSYREYQCTWLQVSHESGSVTFRDSAVITVSPHGRTLATIRFQTSQLPMEPPDGLWKLEGVTSDGWLIDGPVCFLDGWRWDSSTGRGELRFQPGSPISLRHPTDSALQWTDRTLHLKNLHALWAQNWDDSVFSYRVSGSGSTQAAGRDRDGLINAELLIKRPKGSTADVDDATLSALDCLSFAARCPCVAPIEEVAANGQLIQVNLTTSDLDFRATHYLIAPGSLGDFMAVAQPNYRKHALGVGLHTLIAYYCRSHTESMAEFKFLFAGVLMEALKFNWAINIRALPTRRTSTGIVKEFVKPDGRTRYSFKELIDMVASDLGLAPDYTFIENRNAVFHTGEAAAAQQGHVSVWPILKPELQKLHDEIDDLLLTLLGYNGPITSYWDMGQRLQFPGRTPLP